MNQSIARLLLSAIFLLPGWLLAQNVEVTGRVTDYQTGEALPGATLIVRSVEGLGTVTDLDGHFSLAVPAGAMLEISYIGYATENRRISGPTHLEIALRPQAREIEELVIVGAAIRKSDLTGSVARVTAETLSEAPTSSVVQALQGRVPGIYVQSSAAPGSKASIQIRGRNSIHYGTNPIFVIDGLVIEGGFDMLNPEDIASIDILKDASATAIYGSRGANGVIVITTKKGTKGEMRINYDTWYGFQEFSKEMPLMDGNQIFDLRVDAYANAYMDKNPNRDRDQYIRNSLTNTNPIRNLIFSAEELASHAEGLTHSWLDEVVQKGVQQNHSISFSGGHDVGNYFISFNFNDQVGQLANSGYERYSGKVNTEQIIKSWMRVGTNNTFIYTNEQPVANGSMFINSLRASPLLPVSEEYWYLREGKIDNQSANNPLRDLYVDRDVVTGRLLSSNYLNINPIEGLNVRSTFSIDLQQQEDYSYFPTNSTQSYKGAHEGQSVQVKRKNLNWQWDNSITYDRIIAGRHRVNALLGSNVSYYEYNYNQQNASGYNNDLFSYYYPQGASDKDKFYLAGNFTTHSLQSFLGRINYSYASRYYITLTGRYDGSSRFGPTNKWGFFPSVAGSWNITEEAFMQNQRLVENLRLRAGYGIAGNQNIPNYGYMTLFSPYTSLNSNVLRNTGRYGNPYLRWEQQKQLNLGLDAGFFRDRLNLSVDVFQIQNEDLLMERSTAPSSGYLRKIDNVGALENKGIEFMVNAVPVSRGDFSWEVTFNIASDRNKVTRLYDDVTEIYNLGGYSNNEIQRTGNLFLGQPLNTIYVYKFDRIVQEGDMDYVNSLQLGSRIVLPGDILPLDKDGNLIINDLDRFVVGTMDPDFYGGFSTNFRFRGWNLLVNAHYSHGASRISSLYETLMSSYGNSGAHIDLLNRWTPENTDTNVPRAYSDGGRFNLWDVDWAVQDASFIRISEISLSWAVPRSWLRHIHVQNLRFYVTGHNLVTLTRYKGYDPDSGDWYPSSRQMVFGANISI
jgi:TonB-linked SusC/RagA family outer membrane protein